MAKANLAPYGYSKILKVEVESWTEDRSIGRDDCGMEWFSEVTLSRIFAYTKDGLFVRDLLKGETVGGVVAALEGRGFTDDECFFMAEVR